MKKYLSKGASILAVLIVGSIGFLFFTRSQPVLLRIPPDSTIRPRYYCLLNPFRNRAPEHSAESFLSKLREGNVDSISPYVGENKYILEKEKEWPIQSWRVGDRKDATAQTQIMYWVTRGNGYFKDGYEEEIHFAVELSDAGWKIKSYSAVY